MTNKMITSPMNLMTREHARWEEFLDRLEGPEGCNFRYEAGKPTWTCAGDGSENRHSLSRAILQAMGLTEGEINASIAYFCEHGGFCDCEVFWNVGKR